MIRQCLVFLALSMPLASYAEVYRWVDEEGKVRYSDTRPESEKQIEDLSSDYHHPRQKSGTAERRLKRELVEQYWQLLEGEESASESLAENADARQLPDTSETTASDELLKPASKIELDFIFESLSLAGSEQNTFNALANRIYSILQKDFAFPRGDQIVIPVRVYTETEYYGYKSRNGIKGSFNQRSHYSPGRDEIIIIKKPDANDVDLKTTILHEAVHAMVRRKMPYPAAWLNEGLAMYFEQIEYYGQQARSEVFAEEVRWAKYYEQKNELMPLYSYFAVKGKSWRKYSNDRQHVYYMQGWALVAFMCSSDEGREVLRALIDAMSGDNAGRLEREDYFALIEAYYPHGRKFFEDSFFRWVRGLS